MLDFLELTKPRITALILVCTAVGFLFGSRTPFGLLTLVHVLIGTALMASGTSALNQWWEADSDARMYRTRQRPIPAGRMKRSHALVFGVALSAMGFVWLWLGTNALAALLGLFTLLTYLFLYTPLKTVSASSTTIGAVPGAMPPLIGFAAASGSLTLKALALFFLLFVWQFPHFYAIALMYREDYARGRIRMLPVIEPDGGSTANRVVICSILLIPVSLVPHLIGMTGLLYAIAATIGGLGAIYFGVCLQRERTFASARRVLLSSVIYLPILLALMVIDRSRTL
jgi:protoheme IX farnesyltransferase